MNLFTRFLLLTAAMLGAAAPSPVLAESILFESGTLGPTGVTWQQVLDGQVSGENVKFNAFTGARFELVQSVLTTQIGGHFVGPPDDASSFFAAVIKLDDMNDFPDSADLSTDDVLGHALLPFPEPSNEVFGDLEILLSPGWYAIVFGGGLFGASGNGGVLTNNTDLGSPDYIGFLSGFGWGNRLPGKHYVLKGIEIPEPNTLVFALSASLLLMVRKRSYPFHS